MTLLKKEEKKSFNSIEACTGKSHILLCWNSVLKIKAHSSVNESPKPVSAVCGAQHLTAIFFVFHCSRGHKEEDRI